MLIKPKLSIVLFSFAFIVMILFFPTVASRGAQHGIIISASIIIPSLFPFTVCVLLISKCDFNLNNKILNKITYASLGQNEEMFFVFFMSLIGGYPIGTKLINELYAKKSINKKSADIMQVYCVNAGPSFIISAIGCGVFNSKSVGMALCVAHIISSLIIAFICGFTLKKQIPNTNPISKINKSVSQIFVQCVSDATASMLNICAFVILFSTFNSCFDYLFGKMSIIKYVAVLTEITEPIFKYKNIYLTSFLLGFAGVSIWCQVFALSSRKINYFKFITARLIHGVLSVAILKILLIVFKIKISTFSNTTVFNKSFYSNWTLFISMFIMLTVLITFIYTKNNSGKFIKDVI